MLAITPRGVDVDFMAKALWFGVSFAIGVMAGGILFVIDTLRAISYCITRKNAERDAQYEMHAEEDQTGTFENRE